MSTEIKTIRVKATDPEQGEFVVINETDFDPEVHERFDPAPAKPAKAAKAPADPAPAKPADQQ